MRPHRLVVTLAAPAIVLAGACANAPTAPPVSSTAPASNGAAGGGSAPPPAPASAPAKVAGQWAGVFQSTIAYDSNVSFSLAEAGGTVTGTMTFTLKNVSGVVQSPVAGSWDGTTLTLHFSAPNGPGMVVAAPSAHGRYGVGFVSVVEPDSSHPGSSLGVLNVDRI